MYNTPRAMDHGKMPPSELDLEVAVLGAMLLESDALRDVADILKPESFYKIEHQKIFEAAMLLFGRNDPVDIMTVSAQLKKVGLLDMVGGAYYVSKLTDRVAGSHNTEYHARIIAQKFLQRELIRISVDIQNEAYDDTTDALELLDKANSWMVSVGNEISGATGTSMKDLFKEIVEDSERAAAGGSVIGIPIGIDQVDNLTGGGQKGHMDVLAGRPAMGKTSYAIFETYQAAVVQRRPVVFFSLEMTNKELALKLLSTHTGIDSLRLKNGKLSQEEWGIINSTAGPLISAPITIIDNLTEWPRIRRAALSIIGLEQVFLDYLQLMHIPNFKGNAEQMISEMSRGLKSLAKEMNIPVRVLSQLSRAVETRGGTKRPMLSDLRSSGAIEQDADSVTFLYRPEYYGVEVSEETNVSTRGLCEIIVAKNRGGLTGTAPTRVDLSTGIFSDFDTPAFRAPSPPMLEGSKWSPLPKSEYFETDEPF